MVAAPGSATHGSKLSRRRVTVLVVGTVAAVTVIAVLFASGGPGVAAHVSGGNVETLG